MSWINSRKKACDKCGRRLLICDVVLIEGVGDFCLPCAKEFIHDFEIWKSQKDAEKTTKTEVKYNLPYTNCKFCGSLIHPNIFGFAPELRDKQICMGCMEKRILKAIEGK